MREDLNRESRRRLRIAGLGILGWLLLPFFAVLAVAGESTNRVAGTILSVAGTVELSQRPSGPWRAATPGLALTYGGQLRTGEKSRASVRVSDLSVLRVPEMTVIELEAPERPGGKAVPKLVRGRLYLNQREPRGEILLRTPLVSCAIQGTELELEVGDGGWTRVSLIDGELSLENAAGRLTLRRGEQAEVEPGQGPVRTAAIEVMTDLIQWCLYYPAVLDPADLCWAGTDGAALEDSLAAYRGGDLVAALGLLPGEAPASLAGQLYVAALRLAVGNIGDARAHLRRLALEAEGSIARLAAALLRQIDMVKGQTPAPQSGRGDTATELMVASYECQARSDLAGALEAARSATQRSPEFGFAWARVAELEFSFGRTRSAEGALAEALRGSPRNAQAVALQGFVASARGRWGEAEAAFDRAIGIDGALGNAWLGRGLIRLRRGEVETGLQDLHTAVAQEPQRALLRSYLAKAFEQARDDIHARRELGLARGLDPNDPTSWFYAALIDHRHYRTTEALRNLEESVRRNDNRQLYRSRFLLDQDRAVRSANLARVYVDAGMPGVALQESARAVAGDYANASAHLNLASAYEARRDPTRFDLRYDTLWLSEHLLASLLAPVGTVPLSQHLSQMEYSRLFARDGLGWNSTIEILGTGEFRALASQFGVIGGTSYALDLDYGYRSGVAVNDWVSRIEWYSRIQQQLTPYDSVLVLVKYQDYESGDNFQYYDPSQGMPGYVFRDSQAPILLVGGQHEWNPGMRTLYLAGRLVDDREFVNPGRSLPAIFELPGGAQAVGWPAFDHTYASEFEAYGLELEQIWQRERHTDILGARFLAGQVEAEDDLVLNDPVWGNTGLLEPAYLTGVDEAVRHAAVYYYHTWRPWSVLSVLGGVAYEDAVYPANFRRPPLMAGESSTSAWLPKGALVWSPSRAVTLRGVYSESLGEIVYGQSFRLEPTQLAGFGQTYRTLPSLSVIGSTEAALHQIAAGAVDLRLGEGTYGALEGGWLGESGDRTYGLLEGVSGIPPEPATTGSFLEQFDYEETFGRAALHQVLGGGWFAGATYRFTHSYLALDRPGLEGVAGISATLSESADLHEGQLWLQFNPFSGLYARFEAGWIAQDNSDPVLEDDAFPQLNFYLGQRFAQRRGEVILGFLNLTDDDYRINPLTPHPEWPRERTVQLRVRLSF